MDRRGRWWATITYQQLSVPAQPEVSQADSANQSAGPTAGPVVGVDLGVKTLAVAATSDGTLVTETATEGRYTAQLRQLARAQRTVSRRTRPGKGVQHSANRAKAQRRAAFLHDRIGAQRANDLHQVSKAIVAAAARGPDTAPGTVMLEDLNVAGMAAKKRGLGARGRGFNRAITDQGFGELRRQITYKAETSGVGLLLAPRFFPSSKTCGACGTLRLKLSLAERIYLYEECGHTDDRDRNAARNLAAWGETELGMTEPTDSTHSQDRDRDPRGPSATPGNGEAMWHACGPASAGHRTDLPESSGGPDGGGTGRDEAGTRQPEVVWPRRQRGTSRTGTSTTRRDEPITTRS